MCFIKEGEIKDMSEAIRTKIYFRIPVLLLLQKVMHDPEIPKPIIISYCTTQNGAEWICYSNDDVENIATYLNNSKTDTLFVYKLGFFRNQFHIDFKDNARIVGRKEDFPEITDDAVSVDINSIDFIYNSMKQLNFNRAYLESIVLQKRRDRK